MPEESSSSQNVNWRPSGSIEYRRGVSRDGVYAVREDGSSFFIPQYFAERYELEAGQQLSSQEYEQLYCQLQISLIKKAALAFLAVREHSTGELRQKLRKKEFSVEHIDKALALLAQEGSLSDARYAEMWILSRLRRHPEGTQLLAQGLLAKGVPGSVAYEALERVVTPELKQKALEEAYRKLSRKSSKDPQYLIKALTRRGFSRSEIESVTGTSVWDYSC